MLDSTDSIFNYVNENGHEAFIEYQKRHSDCKLGELTEISTAIYNYITGCYRISGFVGSTAEKGFMAYLISGNKLASTVAQIEPMELILLRRKFLVDTIN